MLRQNVFTGEQTEGVGVGIVPAQVLFALLTVPLAMLKRWFKAKNAYMPPPRSSRPEKVIAL